MLRACRRVHMEHELAAKNLPKHTSLSTHVFNNIMSNLSSVGECVDRSGWIPSASVCV